MTVKDRLKNQIESKNPFALIRRHQMRRRLVNKDITFLTPNCLGGILFHDLGLEFCSPTINLMMTQTDFLQFVLNLDSYLQGDFVFFNSLELSCPCAKLKTKGAPDITVVFTHYATEEEALRKWKERSARINKDNMFVFIEERDGLSKEQILSLASLRVKGIIAFTANDYPDIPYALQIEKYSADGAVGNILKRSYWNDSREYEKYIDFVKWFNDADGNNFDVRNFKK